MCFNTIRIINKKYDPSDITSPKHFDLPCRKCPECIDIISSEYAFRAQMETKRCLDMGGLVYFNTFTYKDKFLPKAFLNDGTFISTWNKKHIQLFIKRLRKFFSYYYDVNSNLLRYLITCERGSKKPYRVRKFGIEQIRIATKRPHYHSEFFLYHADVDASKTLPKWCNGLTKLSDVFPIAFQHFWSSSYKFDSFGHIDEVKLTRTPAIASKYVAKYIAKQSNDSLVFSLKNIVSHNQNIDSKHFLPFTLISHGLGSNYEPTYDELVGLKKCEFQTSEGKTSTINLPLYYVRKLCKQVNISDLSFQFKVKESWNHKEGYLSEHIVNTINQPFTTKSYFGDDGFEYPYHYRSVSSDTPLGTNVALDRFVLKCDGFLRDLDMFVSCPEMFTKNLSLFNPLVHKEFAKVGFNWLGFDSHNQVISALDFVFQAAKYLRSKSYSVLKVAIPQYFHNDVDLNDDMSWSMDVLYKFFNDCRNLRNAVKRYCQIKGYSDNKTKAMLDNPELFVPSLLDGDDYNFE